MVCGANNNNRNGIGISFNHISVYMKEHIKKQILEEKLKKKPDFKLIRKLQQLLDKKKD